MTENKIKEVEPEEDLDFEDTVFCYEGDCNGKEQKVISVAIKDKREKRKKLSCGHEKVEKLMLSEFERIGDGLSKALKLFHERKYMCLPDYESENLYQTIDRNYREAKKIHKTLDRWEKVLNVFERYNDLIEREEKLVKHYQEKEQ